MNVALALAGAAGPTPQRDQITMAPPLQELDANVIRGDLNLEMDADMEPRALLPLSVRDYRMTIIRTYLRRHLPQPLGSHHAPDATRTPGHRTSWAEYVAFTTTL
jgi:hypothetical protein